MADETQRTRKELQASLREKFALGMAQVTSALANFPHSVVGHEPKKSVTSYGPYPDAHTALLAVDEIKAKHQVSDQAEVLIARIAKP